MTCISVCIVFVVFVASTRVSSVPTPIILYVSNANPYGDWGEFEYCTEGSYAVGYDMKIQESQGGKDDTALNGIKLLCQSPLLSDSLQPSSPTSSMGPSGDWVGETRCANTFGLKHYLTSFSLQSEGQQPEISGDNTSANYIKFICRDLDGKQVFYEMEKEPGYGKWGSYGEYSCECPPGTAICGLKTRVEKPQGGGDDSALTDVVFHCCD